MTDWVLVDTETDGLMAPIYAIEVAAQRFKGLSPVGDPFRVFINHDIEIPLAATAVHGYTTDFIKQNGIEPQKAYNQLGKYVEGNPIASHFLGFDWNRVLFPEWERLGVQPSGTRGFCTWRLAKRSLPEFPTHKLDYLRAHYGLKCLKPHTAIGDVESVVDLLTRIIFPRLEEKGVNTYSKVVEFTYLHPLQCRCLIQGLKYEIEFEKVEEEKARQKEEKKAERKQREARERFIMEVETGLYPLPKLITDFDLIEEEPIIYFKDHVFLFTGKMKWGSRPEAEKAVAERGGQVSLSRALAPGIDYLILGEDLEGGWTKLLHGGKLTRAFLRKIQGSQPEFRIILEHDFVSALSHDPIKPPPGVISAKQKIAHVRKVKDEYYAKRRAQYSINFDEPRPTPS